MGIIYFHDIPPYTNKKYISIFEIFLKNEDISFFDFLHYLNLDQNTYILHLKRKLTNLDIFLKWTPINIKISAFNTCVTHLWFANTNIQFILNPYTTTTYCTSYVTKIDKSITS
jgi:hypothetical protein